MKTLAVIAALVLLSGPRPAHAASRRLLLFGGGDYTASAMARFRQWSGGRVLFVPWASAEPEDYLNEFKDALKAPDAPALDVAPTTAALVGHQAEFYAQLASATAVFFCGGDQNRVAEELKREPGVRAALERRYREGALFSGTSAGTSVMSEVMVTGEGNFNVIDGSKVGTDKGLALLPRVILDQHFIDRQRENRLFGLVLAHPDLLGLGLAADSALAITDERQAEVVGPAPTMLVRAAGPGKLDVELLTLGRRFELP